jgi:hypothetical protein
MPAPVAVPIAIAAITAISAISSFLGSKKAAKAAKKQSKEEARISARQTTERVRNLGIEERTLYGETVAGYAGGGVQSSIPGLGVTQPTSGSPSTVLAEQARTFQRERAFTEEVGASNAMQIIQGGRATADQFKYQGYNNLATGISSILQLYNT